MRRGADQHDAGAGRCCRIVSGDPAPDTRRHVSGSDPMMLLRVLHAELLKMKRTIALKMVVIAPAVVVLLVLFLASQAPFSTLNRNGLGNKWLVLATLNLRVWAALMMPLFITL